MAKKATLSPITGSPVSQIAAINSVLDDINDKLDNTVSRDGSTPNNMLADLDMDSNDLLNVSTGYLTNLNLKGVDVVPNSLSENIWNQGVTGSVNRSLGSILSERITVKDFGAVGDGVADDGDAIQRAFDWWRLVMLGRGTVIFPQGTYYTTKPFFNDATVNYILAGFAADGAQGLAIVGEYGPTNVEIKPSYTPRGLRTAGLWNGKRAEIPLIEWVQPTKSGSFWIRHITVTGAEDVDKDPVAFKGVNVNLSDFSECVFGNLKNTAFSVESINNSASYHLQIKNCGYQPTNYKAGGYLASGTTFTIASGDATLTCSANVFDSSDVGKWIILNPNSGSGLNPFVSSIASYTAANEVELTDTAPGDYTAVNGSFSIVTGSISAGDKTLTLDADVASSSLRGALIHVYGAGYEDTSGSGGFNDAEARLLSTRIDSITSSSEVELAHGARVSVSNVPVIFMPSMHIGWSSDTQIYAGNNNDVEFYRLRNESSFADNRGYVGLVTQRVYGIWFIGGKIHGTSSSYLNFGANAICSIHDNCKHIIFNSFQHEWGYWDPNYGQRTYLGDRIGVRDIYSHFGHPNLVPTKVNWVSVDSVDLNDSFLDVSGFNNTTNFVETADRKFFKFKNSGTLQGNLAMSASIFNRGTGEHYYLLPRDTMSADNVEPIGNATSGTFTPTLEIGGTEISTASGSYAVQEGAWTRHGRLVFLSIKVELTAKGSATGSVAIRIPFELRGTITSGRDTALLGPVYTVNVSGLSNGLIGRFTSNQLIALYQSVGAGGTSSSAIDNTNITDTTKLEINGWYEINSTQYKYYP